MKLSKYNASTWLFVVVISSTFVFYQIFSVGEVTADPVFWISNLLLSAYCLGAVLSPHGSAVSLYRCYYLFYFIFFGLIPPIEYKLGLVYWGGSGKILDYYPTTMLLGLASILFFQIGYTLFRSGANSDTNFPRQDRNPVRTRSWILISLSALSVLTIYAYNGFSIVSVFVRSGEFTTRADISQMFWLVYQYFIFPVPCLALVAYLFFGRRNLFTTLLLVTLFIIGNPATGMARFQAAAFYIAVLLAASSGIWKNRFALILLLFTGLFVIFPFLDNFRAFSVDRFRFDVSWEFLTEGHFDTFQSVARVISDGTITYGWQIVGAALFFVPRSIWPSKPIGSGAYTADLSNLEFSNISMNLIGEGYINFGFFGAALISCCAGILCARLDSIARIQLSKRSSPFMMFYSFGPGMIFLVLRGDLLSAYAYTAGLCGAGLIIARVSIFRKSRHRYTST